MVVKIKKIVWIKNNGFEIKERELDCYFKNDGSYKKNSGNWESRCYEQFGEEFQLVKDTKELECYNGLTNDYMKDLKILRKCGNIQMNISEYEAMKYVVENWSKEWSCSPYSNSFYSSKDIYWGYKPEGSLRVSDHWNFGDNKEHCPTAEPVDGWAVCRFENGKYHLVKKF